MFRRVEPGFQLPSDQLGALQAVGLQASYGFHGNTVMPFNKDGSLTQRVVVLDVNDADYAAASAFAAQFEAGRDILSHENAGPAQGPYPVSKLFDIIGRTTANTPGVTREDIVNLRVSGATTPVPGSPENNALAGTWDKLAELRAIDPIYYAIGQAGLRGVQLWAADATEKQMRDFLDSWFFLGPPESHRAMTRYYMGPELKFRNNRGLEQLGAAALTLDASGAVKPKLGYIAGGAHQADMDAKLTRHGIPHTSSLFSPDWKKRKQTTRMPD